MTEMAQVGSCPFGSIKEFENYAKKNLSSNAYDYFAGGTEEGITLRENVEAFKRYVGLVETELVAFHWARCTSYSKKTLKCWLLNVALEN